MRNSERTASLGKLTARLDANFNPIHEIMKNTAVSPPEGLLYQSDFISTEEEIELIAQIKKLTFRPFIYQGFEAKRRIVTYGYLYDFSTREFSEAAPIPDFLMNVREKSAAFASMSQGSLKEALLTEYTPGAPIGWHRDLPIFDTVIGISLFSECLMKFKPYKKEGQIYSIQLEPRSIYVMRGAARWSWQHSIPPVKNLRYSITFRSFRGDIEKTI